MDTSLLDSTYLSSSELRRQQYDNAHKAIMNKAKREGLYGLIEKVNAFCEANDIDYFAFADTLKGAIIYKDLIPGSTILEIGMLRADYEHFEKIYFATDEASRASQFGFELSIYYAGTTTRRTNPRINCSRSVPAFTNDGKRLYGKDHLPATVKPHILISLFDAVPDDPDERRIMFYIMRKANRFMNESNAIRIQHYSYKKKWKKLKTRLIPWKMVNRFVWKTAQTYNGKDSARNDVCRVMRKRSKPIPVADIFPLQKRPLGPASIMCPAVSQTWIPDDLDASTQEVKRLQAAALLILEAIDSVCRNNNIRYFICGGTLLGYVRHGGLIPWDDDIDIGMLRTDYERFLQCAGDQLGDAFFLQTRESDPLIPYLFSKVRMNNTEYITKYNEKRDFHKGICIDVFPFDEIPDNKEELQAHKAQVDKAAKQHHWVANHQLPYVEQVPGKPLSFKTKFARFACNKQRKKYWNKSLAETQKAYDAAVKKYRNNKNCNYVASFTPSYTMVQLDDLLPFKDADFEGLTVMVPQHPEVFLQMQYGDYEALPMPHARIGHSLLRWNCDVLNDVEYENILGERH